MPLELEDFMNDMADESAAPQDYDDGFGPSSYLARSILKDD